MNKENRVSTEEYKHLLLELLSRIHSICEENGICYSVAYGTLLGAVRHQGFIPWDDDIDICMLREDYDRFVNAFTSKDGRYYVLDYMKTNYYYNNICRACDGSITLKLNGVINIPDLGAFIDIYPMDRWPESEDNQAGLYSELKQIKENIRYALPWKLYKTAPAKTIVRLLFHPIKRIYNRLIVGFNRRNQEKKDLFTRINALDSELRNFSGSSKRVSWFMSDADMRKRILVPFEDIKIYIPECYDRLLTERYGEYMKLPPEEKRISKHHFTPYWNK